MSEIFEYIWHKWLNRPYRLHVALDQGEGNSVLLLLHGIGADSSDWQPLVQSLPAKKFRVVALDLLGFGDSPKPAWCNYSAEEHARAVAKTIHMLGIGKKSSITVIAHSMGCLVASRLVARELYSVDRLILYEPPLIADQPQKRTQQWRQRYYMAFFEYISDHPELLALQHRRIWRLAQRLSGLTLNEQTWLPFERSLKNTIMQQETFRELQNTRVPTDIIYGRLDFVVIRSGVQLALRQNNNVTLHLIGETHDITAHGARAIIRVLEHKTAAKHRHTRQPHTTR